MLVYENLASSLARLRGFHSGRVLPHEDHHHANERESLLAKSETSRPWHTLRRARGAVGASKLLRLRSVVRGAKGGLHSSARCSSIWVAGGAGTELSPAAGRSRRATHTWRARDRA